MTEAAHVEMKLRPGHRAHDEALLTVLVLDRENGGKTGLRKDVPTKRSALHRAKSRHR